MNGLWIWVLFEGFFSLTFRKTPIEVFKTKIVKVCSTIGFVLFIVLPLIQLNFSISY